MEDFNKLKHLRVNDVYESKRQQVENLYKERDELIEGGSHPDNIEELDSVLRQAEVQLKIVEHTIQLSQETHNESFTHNLEKFKEQREEEYSKLDEIREKDPDNKEHIEKMTDALEELDNIDFIEADLIKEEEDDMEAAIRSVDEFKSNEKNSLKRTDPDTLSKSEGKKRRIETEDEDIEDISSFTDFLE